jgi:hypothetical protein
LFDTILSSCDKGDRKMDSADISYTRSTSLREQDSGKDHQQGGKIGSYKLELKKASWFKP